VASGQIDRLIDEQREDLADLLATLTPEQWQTRSLCDEWTVRDVAVHLVQCTAHWGRFGVEALRSGLRFDVMMSRMARSDRRTPEDVVAALRATVGVRRRPPGTAAADPLMDILVHGQDIAVPLGITRTMPIPAAVIAAERLWGMTFPLNPRRKFAGIEFTATDAEFSAGRGEPVRKPIQDIVLVLAGRPVSPGSACGQ